MTQFFHTLSRAFLLLLLLLPLPACSPAREDEPARNFHPRQPRIAVISPAIAAILLDMGLETNIVGRHGWDQVLDTTIPVCGNQSGLDYEALLRAQPTHVLTEWGSHELPAKVETLAADKGWVLRDFHILTLADIDSAATELETLFPQAHPNERIQRFRHLLTMPPPTPLWEGRVLLLMGTSPLAAIGPGSAHHELLVRAGGVPAISEGSPYMPLHAEDLVRLAPDAIILLQPGDDEATTTLASKQAPGILADLDIPAIEHGRFKRISDPLVLLPSTRLIEVAEQMAQLLDKWAED